MALRTSLVAQPHLYMGDTTGRPLDAGKVYFGQPNKDPEFYPINVFYDEALTIAAPQPIRTVGGFMNANGQMVEVYAAETSYSVKVLDGYGRQVFYQESMSSENAQLAAQSLDTGITVTSKFDGALEFPLSDLLKSMLSVKNFGAVGDGVTDDTLAFQKTANALAALGGGTLVVNSGFTYYLDSVIVLPSNIDVNMTGATLVKYNGTGFASAYSCFATRTSGSLGYGAGSSNITFRGGTVLGQFSMNGDGDISLLTAHLSDDINLYGVTFQHCPLNGHSLDLAACRSVTVRDCTFIGQARPFDSAIDYKGKAECIQLDTSVDGALGYPPDVAASYMGGGCHDVTIDNCKFLPVKVGSVLYPCPNPLGNHSVTQDMPHKNIKFINNLVDTPANGFIPASYSSGVMHFLGVDNLTIDDNVFTTRKVGANIGTLIAVHNGGYASVPNGSGGFTALQPITPSMVAKKLSIKGNKFENFQALSTAQSCKLIKVDGNTDVLLKGGSVSDNEFENCFTDAASVNSLMVAITKTVGSKVVGNQLASCGKFAVFTDCDATNITGTIADDMYNGLMLITRGKGILLSNTNSSSNSGAGNKTPIDVFGSKDILAYSNNFKTSMAGSVAKAISFNDTTTGRAALNTSKSYFDTIRVSDDSTVEVLNNVKL